MATDREVVQLDDDEGGRLHATWSRSGKRLILTVHRRADWGQGELRPEQVAELAAFLAEPRPRTPRLENRPAGSATASIPRVVLCARRKPISGQACGLVADWRPAQTTRIRGTSLCVG